MSGRVFTCFGFLKDEQEAQDVMQEVYLTAFEQLDTLEDAGKFQTWIYRVAANKSINCLKKKKPSLPGDEQLEDMETEENENFLSEEYALNAGKREIVLKIIQETCSDTLYQTILLHYFNEYSIAEIAEIMECPEGTVKYRLSVARAKIKEGVLRYEKKSGDKLYSVAVIPFLTTLFTAQMQGMQMPSLLLSLSAVIPKSTLAASSAKAGGRMVLKGLQLKIVAGIAAVVIVGGGCVYMKDLGICFSAIGFYDEYRLPEERSTSEYYTKYATKPNERLATVNKNTTQKET